MITINLKNRCSSKKSLALFMQTNITHLKELEQTRLCQNADTAFFYAQSPDFLKPGLCYYPKFSYL